MNSGLNAMTLTEVTNINNFCSMLSSMIVIEIEPKKFLEDNANSLHMVLTSNDCTRGHNEGPLVV